MSFDGTVICYLADVSGHGIAAAVLMSMVKSVARTSISRHEPLVDLMQHLNDSLFDLKETSMFVTLACLRPLAGDRLEYLWAGPPRDSARPFRYPMHLTVENGTMPNRYVSRCQFPNRQR